VEQEKAALAFATKAGLDMRVVVPGNLCIGPIATRENGINGTMTRIRDIMSGESTPILTLTLTLAFTLG
tara:strand:- start:48 stop:254 length:207 start_codon:yes stop_codon:yes gene_type:complete